MTVRIRSTAIAIILCCICAGASAQISVSDQRYKADILLVVAHPDDETVVSSYLARAIFDQHKRVAVVYCTRGDSGSNAAGREHGRALGLVREIEARRAMDFFGVQNVWFLDGRDTYSQNVLVSLGAWPSAVVLEQLVRIVRLTQPEVVITWLPDSVAGENHGDHQAAGVLASEAFDMAGDPAAFPAQLAAPIRQYEDALEGLSPWRPEKLYFFTDAFNTDFMQEHGPQYSGAETSPSRKVSYLELAAEAGAAYWTQSPDLQLNRQIEAGQNLPDAIRKMQAAGYFPEPVRLWLGKSLVEGSATGDVFEGITATAIAFVPTSKPTKPAPPESIEVELGGPWGFYREFWRTHGLELLQARRREIAVQPNDTLRIPLVVRNTSTQAVQVVASVILPDGWQDKDGRRAVTVPPKSTLNISLPVSAPAQENRAFAEIRINVTAGGSVVFQDSVFAQVSPYVGEQVK